MKLAKKYSKQIQLIDRVIANKTEGLSHEDSMAQPPFPGNCLNWNLGHIMVSRHFVQGNIDGESAADPDEFAMYGWGSEPLTDSEKAIRLPVLLERLNDASKLLRDTLAEMTDDEFDRIINEERGQTLGDRLNFMLMFHESYHAGMLELLHEMALAQR